MMDPAVIAVSIPIVGSIGLFTMIIFVRYYDNMERMAMIQRGMNPGDLKRDMSLWRSRRRDPYRAMRLACSVIGVGIGLFIGNILRSMDFLNRGGIVAGLVCICGGLGLLAGYFVQMSLQSKMPQQKSTEDESDIL